VETGPRPGYLGTARRKGRKRIKLCLKATAPHPDSTQCSAIFLRPEAQFDTLVGLKDGEDRAQAIRAAMESIEADYATLRGSLPKTEYQEVDNAVLGDLLRALNPEELKRVGGDVFGRIYSGDVAVHPATG